jgi:hypothetical protein
MRLKRTIYDAFNNYNCIVNRLELSAVIEWFPMNLQQSFDRYRERGMQELDAQILVLIEESAAALFKSFQKTTLQR